MSLSDKSDILQQKIKNLPGKPGVYQYFDKEGTIIYVGKAKNLKKTGFKLFHRRPQSQRQSQNAGAQDYGSARYSG